MSLKTWWAGRPERKLRSSIWWQALRATPECELEEVDYAGICGRHCFRLDCSYDDLRGGICVSAAEMKEEEKRLLSLHGLT